MDSLLVVVKLATSDFGLSQAVYRAHRECGDRRYFVDFPGLDNPRWVDRHDHPVGRIALIYSDTQFCSLVRDELEDAREAAKPNQDFAVVQIPLQALTSIGLWDGSSTVFVRRRALRKASDKASERAAQRLREHLARKGKVLESPVVALKRHAIDDQGRWGAIVNPGRDGERVVRSVLTLPSSRGHSFSNALSRQPGSGAPFFGDRDSYGFSAHQGGAGVPSVREDDLFQEIVGQAHA